MKIKYVKKFVFFMRFLMNFFNIKKYYVKWPTQSLEFKASFIRVYILLLKFKTPLKLYPQFKGHFELPKSLRGVSTRKKEKNNFNMIRRRALHNLCKSAKRASAKHLYELHESLWWFEGHSYIVSSSWYFWHSLLSYR